MRRAEKYDHRDTLPPEEYEALTELVFELAPRPMYDLQCFVLGSYNTDANEKQKLRDLQQTVESWTGENCRAYLMEDFTDGLHPRTKFKLIADNSDYILGVCEHDKGGFQLELGMLISHRQYLENGYLLKRRYPSEEKEREKYNYMLSVGVFEMFGYGERLREWEDTQEYEVAINKMLSEDFD